MKRIFFAGALLIILSALSCKEDKSSDLVLWYDEPAAKWEEALPLGNGRLGAMVYGGVQKDQIQFNEETLWAGQPTDYTNYGAANYLSEIRQLIWKGKQKEAEELALAKFMSVPLRQQKYQPFGDLWLEFPVNDSISGYRRELDLKTAVSRTTYNIGKTVYSREYFASFPHNAIVIKITANRRQSVSFKSTFTSLHEDFVTTADENGILKLNVNVKGGALFGEAVLQMVLRGGTVHSTGNSIEVKEADEAVIILTAATNYKGPDDVSGDPAAKCSAILKETEEVAYKELREDHIADYQQYFNRFEISLGEPVNEMLPTDERIKGIPVTMDNSLAALYVQYGRYLLLSSSRPGTYPANLQGIWNDRLNPSWDSKYTVNINTEMNYWPAEVLNIAETHDALFRMIEEVVPSGRKVAKEHYNARGWVLHHNTDIWRGAAPINASNHGIWPTGSGWLTLHFWEHFLYNRDTDFLRQRAWPVMKEAATFYVDFLVRDPATGFLVSVPSNSPENGGLVSGPTMDHQIIKSLFKACIAASEILETETGFADTLRTMLNEIAPYRTGRFGQLQEWMEDKDDPENKHRHISHLWGIHPGKEINWKDNPDLMQAAKVSLEARGDEGTGWSLAWKINFWARLLDGDHAWKMVQMLLRPAGGSGARATGGGSAGGGSYPNLFDAHPPFQIDGNFGGAAGIAEMLLQSHLDRIDILPALPASVPEGFVRGIRARGGFEIDFSWEEGSLTSLKITSKAGNDLNIRYKDRMFASKTSKDEVIVLNEKLERI